MNVAIIGSGNVATVLGRLVHKNGHQVVHVASRNAFHAEALAKEFNASFSGMENTIEMNADVFIIAVSDNAITDSVRNIEMNNKLVLHTAGSVPKDILSGISSNYGVLYPLQSLRKEISTIPEIPFLIDGSNADVTTFIQHFAASLSKDVRIMNDEDRLKLHAAAVVVNNFTNHLYALAESFCDKEHVDFNLLKPLILETATRLEVTSPSALQTGPAVRKDIHTLDKHLRLFNNHTKLKYLYLKMTDSIMSDQ